MKKYIITLFLCFCALTLAACGNAKEETGASAGYTVTDDMGRSVYLSRPPQRMVSVSYGIDEILADMVDLSRIRAFSQYAGDDGITFITKEEAARVGHTVYPHAESIVAEQPDLVFVTVGTGADVIDTLTSMGIPVYVSIYPKSWNELQQKIRGIARAVREEQRGEDMIRVMDDKRHAVEERLSAVPKGQERSALALSFSGLVGKPDTILADMMFIARIDNSAAHMTVSSETSSVSKEQIVAADPEVLLLPTWNFNGRSDAEAYKDEIYSDPAYAHVRAVMNRRLVYVSDKYRYVSSQYAADSLSVLAKAVYPELWESPIQ